ncbi:MAG: arabinose-5-phosphate isomerase KdsD [Pantoea sp. Brub]|nr:arabinose-5-phosphate isomerase KdsD [Pantoea sp. Brub]
MLNKQLTINFNFEEVGKKVFHIEQAGLKHVSQYVNKEFTNVCNMIYYCKGKVILMGIGKSGHIGKKIASTFASTGTPSFFVHPGEANHGDLGMISYDDIVIAISNSGESNEILTLIPIIKRKNIKVICMTSRVYSSMSKIADVHLCIKVPQEACPLGLAPTSSTTATLVMGDALAISLLEARGFTIKDFALSHPGGVIGRKLLIHVSDIMHTGCKIPYIKNNASLYDALIEITNKNLGLVVIVDDLMNIQGIFTDGDLRRVLNTGVNLKHLSILDVMTHTGIKVNPNVLAVDALQLMQINSVTSLLVSENKSLLVGVVHIHDIVRAGVI